jgi:hypothetical protein
LGKHSQQQQKNKDMKNNDPQDLIRFLGELEDIVDALGSINSRKGGVSRDFSEAITDARNRALDAYDEYMEWLGKEGVKL